METAPRNCRFLSLVVVELVLIKCCGQRVAGFSCQGSGLQKTSETKWPGVAQKWLESGRKVARSGRKAAGSWPGVAGQLSQVLLLACVAITREIDHLQSSLAS